MGCRIFLGLSTSVSSWRSFLSSPTLSSRYCFISWIKTCIYLYLGCAALFEARNQHRSWGDKSFGEWMSWGFSLSPQWRWLQHWMMTYPTYQFALNLPWGKIQNLNLEKYPNLSGCGKNGKWTSGKIQRILIFGKRFLAAKEFWSSGISWKFW